MIVVPAIWPPRGGGQVGRGRPRVRGQAGGGQPAIVQSGGGKPACAPARFYAFPARPDVVASDAVIIGIISVCGRDASVLFDPGSTYLYASSLFAHFLGIPHESLGTPVYVSISVGDSVVVDQIYRSCVVTFCGYETRANLLLLDMTDFEVILGMDWLPPYHVILDCHAKTITLAMPEFPRLEWKGEKVPLKVSPMKGIMRFGKKGKLSPRFIGPFEVLRWVEEVAYEPALPPSLSGVHLVFHVSMLWGYHANLSHVLDFSTIQLDESLGYEEEPIAIVAK
ncbi:uncharacterized protein [Nicotiana tomentosiformis]|uniref:uncharacterized protein n=1 Tax=Nicotiana tomentosiformis TaxID=4098 RepID=UPI00388C4E83